MAVRGVAKTPGSGKMHRFTWEGLLNGDSGTPVSIPGAADMTVQVIQVAAGTGDTIILEGSLEETPSKWFQMRDGGDNLISFTGDDGEAVSPVVMHVRPRVTAGDGTTDFTTILLARSTMRQHRSHARARSTMR